VFDCSGEPARASPLILVSPFRSPHCTNEIIAYHHGARNASLRYHNAKSPPIPFHLAHSSNTISSSLKQSVPELSFRYGFLDA